MRPQLPHQPAAPRSTPHKDIVESAAFLVAADEAVELGCERAKLMQDKRNFHCAACSIPLKGRKVFKGRALPRAERERAEGKKTICEVRRPPRRLVEQDGEHAEHLGTVREAEQRQRYGRSSSQNRQFSRS
eukprot:5359889-Pyramimonas_sp.AAC.1